MIRLSRLNLRKKLSSMFRQRYNNPTPYIYIYIYSLPHCFPTGWPIYAAYLPPYLRSGPVDWNWRGQKKHIPLINNRRLTTYKTRRLIVKFTFLNMFQNHQLSAFFKMYSFCETFDNTKREPHKVLQRENGTNPRVIHCGTLGNHNVAPSLMFWRFARPTARRSAGRAKCRYIAISLVPQCTTRGLARFSYGSIAHWDYPRTPSRKSKKSFLATPYISLLKKSAMISSIQYPFLFGGDRFLFLSTMVCVNVSQHGF